MKTPASLLSLLALLPLVPAAAQDSAGAAVEGQRPFHYLQRGPELWRQGPGGTFRVDPEVISVRFAPGVADLEGLLARLDPTLSAGPLGELRALRSNRLGIWDLALPPGTDVLAALAALRASGLVELAEENTVGTWTGQPNDPQFDQQWHLSNSGQAGGTIGADIGAVMAWDTTAGDPSIVLAILDAGLDVDHPDLAPNLWSNPGEVINGLDDDANGFIDDHLGWDFQQGDNNPNKGYYHGSFVSGVAAARTGNGKGVAGVAGGDANGPGCSIMTVAVGSSTGVVASVVDDAILYAADNGADVFNLSIAIGTSTVVNQALDYARNTKGVFIVGASGNVGASVSYPARNPDVVAVGGSTNKDLPWGFSGTGPQLWVVAPSVDIYSTGPAATYGFDTGTSHAAAQVTGLAGLCLSLMPSLGPDELDAVLQNTSLDLDAPGHDEVSGWGRIDAAAAMAHLIASDCNGNGLYDPSEVAAGTALDLDGDGQIDACQALSSDVAQISLSSGGSALFSLKAGAPFAGELYFLLASVSGTTPGFFLDGQLVPLNFDTWFVEVLVQANSPVLPGFIGALDPSGSSLAALVIPPATAPILSGLTVNHAFVVVGSASLQVDFASGAIPVGLVL